MTKFYYSQAVSFNLIFQLKNIETHHLWKARNWQDLFASAILFCWSSLQSPNFWGSQTLAHDFEMCCTHYILLLMVWQSFPTNMQKNSITLCSLQILLKIYNYKMSCFNSITVKAKYSINDVMTIYIVSNIFSTSQWKTLLQYDNVNV